MTALAVGGERERKGGPVYASAAVQSVERSGSFPHNCDVHCRDPQRPVNVDSSRPVSENSGHVWTAWRAGQI
jgi:hypothetical protein